MDKVVYLHIGTPKTGSIADVEKLSLERKDGRAYIYL